MLLVSFKSALTVNCENRKDAFSLILSLSVSLSQTSLIKIFWFNFFERREREKKGEGKEAAKANKQSDQI